VRKLCVVGVSLASVCLILAAASAYAIDVGYYFDVSNELSDLPYPGTEFYGEVDLSLLALNTLRVDVNAFASLGQDDYLGNYITSPLQAGSNFGIQKFGINSPLIASQGDFDAFCTYYDITLPNHWGFDWGGVAGELGKFEFWYNGTGNSRQDPLVILITPKIGAVIPTGFEIDSVFDFVEMCPQGTYFSMHVGGFSTDPSYWSDGCSDVNSAFFAVDGETYIIPEPATALILFLGLATLLLRARRR
jgi:hypothetical protein